MFKRREIYSVRVNPVALITGASRGIGRGIALELAKIGYDLVLNFASNAASARQAAADCVAQAKEAGQKIQAEICQADVASVAERKNLIDLTKKIFGRLDLLVNNAGVAPNVRADILEATEASFDRLIAVNVKGPYFLTQLAARWMIELGAFFMRTESELILKSRRVVPGKLLASGFSFQFPTWPAAAHDLVRRRFFRKAGLESERVVLGQFGLKRRKTGSA